MSNTWSRPSRYIALGVLLLLLAGFIYFVRPIIGPLVISALLAYLLDPLVQWLTRVTPLKKRVAVAIVYFLSLALILLLPAAVAPLAIAQIDTIQQDAERLISLLSSSLAELSILGISPLESISFDFQEYFNQLFHPDQIFGALRAVTENAVWVLVVLITTYYLMQDWHRLRQWAKSIFPEAQRDDMRRLFSELSSVWRYFLRGQLSSMFLVGVISGISAALLGLPGAAVFGLLAAALAVIPSVGSSTMIAVAVLVALFSGSSYLPLSPILTAAITASAFTAIHLFENYWLRPRILGQRLQLHPGVVLIAIIGALTLGGILEALLIVPLLRSANILGGYLWRRILGEEPWEEDEAAAS